MLSVKNLCKKFGAVTASDNVSLEVANGEIHALIGPNGAGKSTLIQQISGVLRQDSGQIRLDGTELTPLSVASRARSGLARSFQVSSVVTGFTALQNVLLAVQGRSGKSYRFFKPVLRQRELIDQAHVFLERVGLSERASVLASALAHGERRKLELSMALALQPKLFLLDEPMAGVGASGSKAMTMLLSELKHSAPILLVEHDMDAVFTLADRISVLEYGKIIASGSVEEIRQNAVVRKAYMGDDIL